MVLEVVAVVVVLVLLAFYLNKDPPGLPPGPSRYPLIGCIETCQSLEDCKKFQKKYGDTFSVRIGSQTFVTMCNFKTMKEAFARYEFIDRPNWQFINFFSEGEMRGIVFKNGVQWQTLRRFMLRHLRDMGMGKSRLDDVILREAEELVKDFKKYTHGPTFFPNSINIVTLNIIWQLVASRRYDMDNEEIRRFVVFVQEFQDEILMLAMPDFFTWLNYLPGPLLRRLCGRDKLNERLKIGRAMMEEAVSEHRASLDPDNPRDVLDEFLLEMENQKNDPNTVFNEQDLIKTIFDLFTAGYDTTSSMLRWVILHMVDKPEVQRRVQQELDEVVDRATLPSHVHRPQLPYLDATINEVLRMSSVASGGVPHAAAHDTYIDNYFIPKGVTVAGHIGFCHKDPNYWDEPEQFRPERFLNESGKLSIPKEAYLPFGIGKRSCLGEALARMELYVFSAALLQNFTFGVPEGRTVDLSPRAKNGNNFPTDQEIVIRLRH